MVISSKAGPGSALLREGGFTGTHLWLKSFLGLPQLINHGLVGVLCLGSSTNSQPARGGGCAGWLLSLSL